MPLSSYIILNTFLPVFLSFGNETVIQEQSEAALTIRKISGFIMI